MRVTIIGGGSYQWAPKLMTDLLGTPSLAGLDLVLEDVDPAPLPKMEAMARMAAGKLGVRATVSTTTDQRAALDGADFVIVTISTGGFESMSVDLDVPWRHGIRQSVGDTVGPGGISRSLRNVPVLVGIGHDMEEMCPDAWLLNITNPMTCLTRAVCRETSVKTVGLCHEVGNFCLDLAIALGKPHNQIRPEVVGVNHLPFVVSLDVDGTDGLALLRSLVEEHGGLDALSPAHATEPAEPFTVLDFLRRNFLKLSLLDRMGALPAAGDRHVAEFLPSVLTAESNWGEAWGVSLTTIAQREKDQASFVEEVDAVLTGRQELATWDSGELVAPVIDSLLTGTRRDVPLNLPNRGQCPDLPGEAVVEAICTVDGDGMRARNANRAPAAVTELLRRHVATQELTVEAALSGDRATAHGAFALDPLAGRGDLVVRETMVDELLDGTARWLPRFAAAGR